MTLIYNTPPQDGLFMLYNPNLLFKSSNSSLYKGWVKISTNYSVVGRNIVKFNDFIIEMNCSEIMCQSITIYFFFIGQSITIYLVLSW